LSGLMKKNKRALINFQEDFLIPFIERAAWRFMQFDPERYPVKDFKFMPVSTMGMVAREYEQQQMVGLMQTLGPQSPITPVLLQGIVQSSSLSNREDIIAQLQKMSQPDPEAQQRQMQEDQLKNGLVEAQINYYNSQSAKNAADAAQTQVETQIMPQEVEAKMVGNISRGSKDPSDFDKRVKVAELALKEQDIKSNERISVMQMQHKKLI